MPCVKEFYCVFFSLSPSLSPYIFGSVAVNRTNGMLHGFKRKLPGMYWCNESTYCTRTASDATIYRDKQQQQSNTNHGEIVKWIESHTMHCNWMCLGVL